jgi:hypothetical protein
MQIDTITTIVAPITSHKDVSSDLVGTLPISTEFFEKNSSKCVLVVRLLKLILDEMYFFPPTIPSLNVYPVASELFSPYAITTTSECSGKIGIVNPYVWLWYL